MARYVLYKAKKEAMIAAVIASVSSAVGPHAVSFFLTAALVGSRSAFMKSTCGTLMS